MSGSWLPSLVTRMDDLPVPPALIGGLLLLTAVLAIVFIIAAQSIHTP